MIEEFVPPKTKELNQKAFLLGRDWVEQALEMPQTHEPLMDPEISFLNLQKKSEIELEITESWCKGCDICVKMCPERCLKLNSEQVVELTDANACTGWRICEWLCPDLAIKLHLHLPAKIPN